MNSLVQEIKKILSRNYLSKSDVSYLLIQIRKLIETNNLQEKYKHLNFYCNWYLHTSITGSMVVYRMLEKINLILLKNRNSTNVNAIGNKISECISLKDLKVELIQLFDFFKIENKLGSDDSVCFDFVGTICALIIEQPISFPTQNETNNKSKIKSIFENIKKEIEAEISTDEEQKKWFVTSLKLIVNDENKILWKLTTEGNIHIQGQLTK